MDDDDGFEEEEAERPRDHVVDTAKVVLLREHFPVDGNNVYYGRQIEVLLEHRFFHWIAKKALNELAEEKKIKLHVQTFEHYRAHFYWPLRHRYPRRQIREVLGLITEFSKPSFTRALGQHGELLTDAGFASVGFRIVGRKVREVEGKRWERTNHDLDRLIERDGVRYGVEIKNQLGYIDQGEFEIKLAMCRHLGVRPMFVARMMPKNYIERCRRAGGFCLIMKNQHYPLLADELARRVRERLQLPVLCLGELPDTTMRRFEAWHEKQVGSKGV